VNTRISAARRGKRKPAPHYGDSLVIPHFRDAPQAPALLARSRPAPRRHSPSRRPHGSMDFRSFAAVNGAPLARRLRRSKTIDSRKTSEKRGFHEVDGAPRRARADRAAPPLAGHGSRDVNTTAYLPRYCAPAGRKCGNGDSVNCQRNPRRILSLLRGRDGRRGGRARRPRSRRPRTAKLGNSSSVTVFVDQASNATDGDAFISLGTL
jgi:hypothetical protein